MREGIAAVVVEANGGSRGDCYPCGCVLVKAFVPTCGLIGRDNNRGCRYDCYSCECIVVEAFVFVGVPIGRDSILFLKVALFLDVAQFSRITMLGETQETPQ